jgi:hypothetical protein
VLLPPLPTVTGTLALAVVPVPPTEADGVELTGLTWAVPAELLDVLPPPTCTLPTELVALLLPPATVVGAETPAVVPAAPAPTDGVTVTPPV